MAFSRTDPSGGLNPVIHCSSLSQVSYVAPWYPQTKLNSVGDLVQEKMRSLMRAVSGGPRMPGFYRRGAWCLEEFGGIQADRSRKCEMPHVFGVLDIQTLNHLSRTFWEPKSTPYHVELTASA